MASEPDIFRAAKLLLDQHGEDAMLRHSRAGRSAPTRWRHDRGSHL